jgi:folate-dependent phosphoribosylglycinamide formyltransferase PurN
MPTGHVALLVIDSDLCRIAARSLAIRFPDLTIIVEQRVSRGLLLRRRIARLGLVTVVGQLAFMLLARVLQWASSRRIAEILDNAKLESRWPEGCELIAVPSVNSPECIALLQNLDARAILVVGTRIIGRAALAAVPAPFINYHDGITPKYRGIHGGYWALAEGDPGNFGVTVHLIDAGIDTGDVLYQTRLSPTARDNYATFPYLQLVTALPLIAQAAGDAVSGTLKPSKAALPSRLWSHPTVWSYVAAGLKRSAW